METVTYEVQAGVAVVTLRRPEVRNAVDDPTAAALDAAFHRFEADDACAVAILTGAGGHFCAGADLKAVAAGARVNLRETGLAPMGPTRRCLPKPVIAAIEGYAVAGWNWPCGVICGSPPGRRCSVCFAVALACPS